MSGIVISIGHQSESLTLELDPRSRAFLAKRFPGVQPAASVFLSYDSPQDLAAVTETTWEHIAELLTGLRREKLDELGGFEVVEPVSRRRVYESWNSGAAA